MLAGCEVWRGFPKSSIGLLYLLLHSRNWPPSSAWDRTCHLFPAIPGTGLLGISQAVIQRSACIPPLGKMISKQNIQLCVLPLKTGLHGNNSQDPDFPKQSPPLLRSYAERWQQSKNPAVDFLCCSIQVQGWPSFLSMQEGENSQENTPAFRQCFTSHRQTCSLPCCYLK